MRTITIAFFCLFVFVGFVAAQDQVPEASTEITMPDIQADVASDATQAEAVSDEAQAEAALEAVAPPAKTPIFAIWPKQLDAGLSGGVVFYGDMAGVDTAIETRAYILKTRFGIHAFAGAGGLFQYTASSKHIMSNTYGYALGGADWYFLRDKTTSLAALALRAQLVAGGGYTSDKNSDGSVAGYGGFIVQPSIGADYGFGKIHASLMFGYQMIIANGTLMAVPTLSAGISYRILDRSDK